MDTTKEKLQLALWRIALGAPVNAADAAALIDDLIAERIREAEWPKKSAWRPIGGAPKDRPILLRDKFNCPVLATWIEEKGGWHDVWRREPTEYFRPVEWAPLPQ